MSRSRAVSRSNGAGSSAGTRLELAEHVRGPDPRSKHDAADGDDTQGVDDRVRIGVLEQVPVRPGAQCAGHDVLVVGHRQHEDPRLRPGEHDPADGVDTVTVGQGDVHRHDG